MSEQEARESADSMADEEARGLEVAVLAICTVQVNEAQAAVDTAIHERDKQMIRALAAGAESGDIAVALRISESQVSERTVQVIHRLGLPQRYGERDRCRDWAADLDILDAHDAAA